jgi:predicted nucleic acid-binding protein
MRILFDTDVLMDFILKRELFSDDAEKVIALCLENDIKGCISAHTVPNLHYILRKHLTTEQRKGILLDICRMFTVVGIDAEKLISALHNDDFIDFEDCLQVECAKDFDADYIITRNIKDFRGASVPVLEPSEFIKKF